jgi:hypothetical protein
VLGLANTVEPSQDNWYQLAPLGDFPHARGVQKFDQVAMENIVRGFERDRKRLGKRFVGAPVYVGHPDVPHRRAEFTDTKAYGWVQQLEPRGDGLWGRVEWGPSGQQLVENKHYKFFSPYWGAEEIGQINSKKLLRPVELVSVGLTNEPNIPVLPLANDTKENTMDYRAVLIALLGLENTATDTQIEHKQKELTTKVATLAALENAKKEAETALATEKAARTTDQAKITTLENQVKSLSTARNTILLDNAIADGRITPAQRTAWAADLENSFDAKSVELSKLQAKTTLPTQSKTGDLGPRREELENAQQKQQQIQAKVQEKVRAGMDYDTAFNQVRLENAALFQGMAEPKLRI